MRAVLAFLAHMFRAVRIAATDKRIPRSLRWLAALGLLPIPGPVDEIVLLIVAVPLALFYRGPLHEAWRQAGEVSSRPTRRGS
jgi:hypothetical protein